MAQKDNQILKKVLFKIIPSKEEFNSIKKFVKEFIADFEKKLREQKIEAQVFVGGSFAKDTMIKKGLYDVDIFVRFDGGYIGKDISKLLERELSKIKIGKVSKIHGSRDYFKIEPEGKNFFLEIIPVIKVKNPKDAENITDLSYFHVNYIKKKIKTDKTLDEIRLAKAFCHANKCYGAESYIGGFSGYALELLIIYYKSFLNFVKAMTKVKDKVIIDIEKLYKNKYEIDMNMNGAKMESPIILIDPTYRERNALAALSDKTFKSFQEVCKNFVGKISEGAFETKKVNLEKMKKISKGEFISLKAVTDKQEGDVAGSKLVKFYRYLSEELEKFYNVVRKEFEYNGKKEARYFFVVETKKEIIFSGPEVKDKSENVKRFKQRHKNIFEKNGRFYAREKNDKRIKEFMKEWINKNSERIREMYLNELKIED